MNTKPTPPPDSSGSPSCYASSCDTCCAYELANEQLRRDVVAIFGEMKQIKESMKYIIETGNDGGDSSVVGWSFDFCAACNEVARIMGKECYVKTKPIGRGKKSALWPFIHDGRTKWIRVKQLPSAEDFPAYAGCIPVPDSSFFA